MRTIGKRMLAFLIALLMCITSINVPVNAQNNEQAQSRETISSNEANTSVAEVQKSDWDGVTTQEIYEGDNYKITFILDGYWDGGYNAKVKIKNTSDTAMDNWYLTFDFANTISNIWNAEISSFEDGNYIVKNAGYNQDIVSGETIEFGFGSNENFKGFPVECVLLDKASQESEEEYTVNYRLENEWNDGFTGTITITNNGEKTIEDWCLGFDFENTITDLWNGIVETHEEDHYVVKNAGHNGNIASGQSVSFGFTGTYTKKNIQPTNYTLFSMETVTADETESEDYYIVNSALANLNIGYVFGDTKDSVTSNLILPDSSDGATIEWSSSNTNIINQSGEVTRPSGTSEYVTLTATATSNEYSNTKEFTLYVIKNTYVDYNLNYIEDLESLELLYLYNDGDPEDLEVYLNEEGYISYISGAYSDFVVESPEEAILALHGIKTLMGVNDPKEELRWRSTTKDKYGTSFRFEQMYKNIPIYGMDIVVSVDTNGKTSSLYSSFTADINLNTTPAISEESVTDTLSQQGYSCEEGSSLCVYIDDSEPKLAWNVNAIFEGEPYTVLVDAKSGSILFTNALVASEAVKKETTAFGKNYYGNLENFSVSYEGEGKNKKYYLYDISRNIKVYDATGISSTVNLPGDNNIWNTTNEWTPGEVSAMANVAKAYDFYKNNYGYAGLEGDNSETKVSINFGIPNSYSLGGSNGLAFGKGGDYIYGAEAALDTVGHEYTHAVIRVLTSIMDNNTNEPGAINEGYADIFGYFIENDGDPEWLHREDNIVGKRALRNMSNPIESDNPCKIGGDNYYDYVTRGSEYDNGGIHINSTIVSHACYLMWKNGITNKQRLADLWYHSLLLGYDGNSTFSTVRQNVLTSAKNMGMSGDEIQIIKDAFDSVGIVGTTEADINGTNILSGKIVEADADLTLGNNLPLADAKISLTRVGEKVSLDNFKTAVSKADGTFTIINIIPGTYKLTVSKSGYYTATQYISLTSTKINNYCSTIELIPNTYTGFGSAKGNISDSVTGDGVEGLKLRVRRGMNTKTGSVVATLKSGEDGAYVVESLTSGQYCVEVIDQRDTEEEKYLTTYFNIKVLGGRTISNQNATVSTTLDESQLRIVLTWGIRPLDLDSHLLGPKSEGGEFHIYYGNKSYREEEIKIADLDLDDRVSYGPETTTLYNPVNGTYIFYIYNFSGNPAITTSGASVSVYTGSSNEPAYVFYVPTTGSGRHWTVFTYNSITRKIKPVNVVDSFITR